MHRASAHTQQFNVIGCMFESVHARNKVDATKSMWHHLWCIFDGRHPNKLATKTNLPPCVIYPVEAQSMLRYGPLFPCRGTMLMLTQSIFLSLKVSSDAPWFSIGICSLSAVHALCDTTTYQIQGRDKISTIDMSLRKWAIPSGNTQLNKSSSSLYYTKHILLDKETIPSHNAIQMLLSLCTRHLAQQWTALVTIKG